MKVLIVIPYFIPATSYGGPVKVSYDMAKGLVSRGHEVVVATTDAFDERRRLRKTREEVENIRILRFRNISNFLAKRINGYTPLMFIPWLVRHGREFDFIYCHDFYTLQNIAVNSLRGFHKVPFLIQPHGCLSSLRRKTRFPLIKSVFTRIFYKILRNSQNIIALTEEEKKTIVALDHSTASKVVVVPNGLEPDEFSGIEKTDICSQYKIPKGSKVIGFIGRLSFIKGIDISLEVLALLKSRCNFSFLIIGPDEGEMSHLKHLAQKRDIGERVIFAGILNGIEKLRTIKSCDLFLFTSRDEGLPMTVLEVAALGIPQVISRECNVPELAAYKAGYVHACNDIPGFANSVEKILSNRDEWQNMSANAQLMIRERFSLNKMLDSIERLMLQRNII